MATINKTALPSWTSTQNKNGLDPLGMQTSSVDLYQRLLPGVSNVTLRMRYYGLYCWLSQAYAEKFHDTNPEVWKTFIRRAEALYALIADRHGKEFGVAGIEWAQKHAKAETIDFVEAAAPEKARELGYLKQSWGAFGAAYGSQLFEIGIFGEAAEDHDIPLPSEVIGQRLVSAFANGIKEEARLFLEVVGRGRVLSGELAVMRRMSPSEIVPGSPECDAYEALLLRPANDEPMEAHVRRRTLLLVLRIADLLGRAPTPDEVRWTLFAGRDSKGNVLKLPGDDLVDQRRQWWAYHADDLCHVAMETLLKFSLDVLAEIPAGMPAERLIGACVDRLIGAADVDAKNWADLVLIAKPAPNPYSKQDPGSDWILSDAVVREAGRTDAKSCGAGTAWKAIRLLAVLSRRLMEDEPGVRAMLDARQTRHSMRSLSTEMHFLEENSSLPMREFLSRLIEERIVLRHLRVAVLKLRGGDYTFLFEQDNGLLRVRAKDGPTFTNPRLGPAITFLRDIHLLGDDGPTEAGRAIMVAAA